MTITGRARLQINTRSIREGMREFRMFVAEALAEEIVKQAKQNVSPNVGPGPHPHREPTIYPPHVDSGFLRDSIDSETIQHTAKKTVVMVHSDLEHERPFNIYLELGWVNPDFGTFHRYPFMWPAAEKVAEDFPHNVANAIHGAADRMARNIKITSWRSPRGRLRRWQRLST